MLKNLTKSEVIHFRKQIKLHEHVGRTDISELASQLELLNRQATPPYKAGLKVDLVEIERAVLSKRLKLDPSGYFVIIPMQGKEYPLLVEHYSNDGRLRNMVEGKDAASICSTLIEKELVSQLDHASYLGRELVKAEMSLVSDLKYIQDKASGELQSE